MDILYNQTAKVTADAVAAAAINGITNGSGGAVVTVNTPPSYGYHQSPGYVEVIISQPNKTFFMKVLNSAFSSLGVSARAVAGAPNPSSDCIYVLDPSASQAMKLQGSFDVSAPKCGIVVDSKASDALQFTGGGGTLTAGSIGVVGGDGGQTGDSSPPPVTGIVPVSDPFKGEYTTAPACTFTSSATSVKAGDAAATVGGVVCFTKAVTLNGPLILASGTYVFNNGVTLGGAITSGAGGTTFDIAGGDLSINTGTTLNLFAPTSGTYNGIVLMDLQPSGTQLTLQKGNASGSMTGIIYAPYALFFLNDSGGDKSGGLALTADLVVGTLYDKTATLTVNSYSAANPYTTPLRAVSLVE